jgi:hypothetical protein
MIFINLPVASLEHSRRFHQATGNRQEPTFSNEHGAIMYFPDKFAVILPTDSLCWTFTAKPTCDAHRTSSGLLYIGCDSPRAVDTMVAAANDGRADPGVEQDMNGLVYDRGFQDPDGHYWEPMWMDPSATEQGASAIENA